MSPSSIQNIPSKPNLLKEVFQKFLKFSEDSKFVSKNSSKAFMAFIFNIPILDIRKTNRLFFQKFKVTRYFFPEVLLKSSENRIDFFFFPEVHNV